MEGTDKGTIYGGARYWSAAALQLYGKVCACTNWLYLVISIVSHFKASYVQ